MRPKRSIAWVLGLVLGTLGCGDPSGTDAGVDAASRAPRVEMGTGTSTFEPIPETGAELELVRGPQGGYHVFVAARLYDLEPEGLRLFLSAVDTSTAGSVGTDAEFRLVRSRVQPEGDHFVRVGDFLILHDDDPDAVRGLTLTITVRAVEEGTGLEASDRRTVLIVDNEMG